MLFLKKWIKAIKEHAYIRVMIIFTVTYTAGALLYYFVNPNLHLREWIYIILLYSINQFLYKFGEVKSSIRTLELGMAGLKANIQMLFSVRQRFLKDIGNLEQRLELLEKDNTQVKLLTFEFEKIKQELQQKLDKTDCNFYSKIEKIISETEVGNDDE